MTSTKTYFFVALICLLAGLFIGYSFKLFTDSKTAVESGHNMTMDQSMGAMTGNLEGKSGDEFDKAFIDGMIVHHKGAVAMAELVLKNSKRPELIKLADEIIIAQTREINQMMFWRDSWFKASTVAPANPSAPLKPTTPVACTMDAKICPDGSAVGRTGPNCEFAPCPGN